MIRTLKTLCICLVAACSMGSAVPAAASGEDFSFHADGHYVTFTALQIGEFTGEFGKITCTQITWIGEIFEIATDFDTVELTATSANCHIFKSIPVHLDMNGCEYVLHAGTKAGATYEGSASIECPPEEEIVLTATVGGVTKCTVHVPEQGPMGTVTFQNGPENVYFIAQHDIEGLEYSQTAGTGTGSCETSLNRGDGAYEGETTVSGDNDFDLPTNIWVG